MKVIKNILVVALVVLATFTIGATAEAVLKTQQKKVINNNYEPSLFDAEITFYIYDGTGCGCKPIIGAFINATSGEGPAFGITDENGTCTLQMVINSDYRVTIEALDYNTIMYDFNVVDDQTFKFHAGEANSESMQCTPSTQCQNVEQMQCHHLRIVEGKNNAVK